MLLSFVGICEVLTQSFGIAYLTKQFTEQQLILGFVVASSVVFIGLSSTVSLPVIALLLAPNVLSNAVVSTCLTSLMTKSVSKEEIGVTIGVTDALESLSRAFTPTLGGILMETLGSASTPLLSALINASLGIFVWTKFSGDEIFV